MRLDNVNKIELNNKTVHCILSEDNKIMYEENWDKTTNPLSLSSASIVSNGSGYSSTQNNGVWSFTNAFLEEGWENTLFWEVDYDLQLTGCKYIYMCILANAENYNQFIGGWEGPLTNLTGITGSRTPNNDLSVRNGDIFNNPSTPWVHINIKKISGTQLLITKTNDNVNNGSVLIEWADLSSVNNFTIGAKNNGGSNFGSNNVQIKNLKIENIDTVIDMNWTIVYAEEDRVIIEANRNIPTEQINEKEFDPRLDANNSIYFDLLGGTTNQILLEIYNANSYINKSPYWVGTIPQITIGGVTYTGFEIYRRSASDYYLVLEQIIS